MDFSTTQGMAVTRQGSRSFATGIAAGNQKSLAFNKYAADIMREVAVDLFKEQADVAETYLNRRTGQLLRHLKSSPFEVSESGGNVRLDLKYILQVRFIDLKKTGKSKPKRNYVQLYNRLVWGYMFGNLYPQLRYGFTRAVRQKYVDKLSEQYKDLEL